MMQCIKYRVVVNYDNVVTFEIHAKEFWFFFTFKKGRFHFVWWVQRKKLNNNLLWSLFDFAFFFLSEIYFFHSKKFLSCDANEVLLLLVRFHITCQIHSKKFINLSEMPLGQYKFYVEYQYVFLNLIVKQQQVIVQQQFYGLRAVKLDLI
eukprot:TRINITY_DN2244_c3_g1_i1.p2 TRINITY_DN2244_c3_g1~~TRINITY_DN2244_c3_g1_i1.p2  ORF type:complete len:150 (+),score=8.89 TRINITY_DN2244_c3_g1_i1:485-934(+)